MKNKGKNDRNIFTILTFNTDDLMLPIRASFKPSVRFVFPSRRNLQHKSVFCVTHRSIDRNILISCHRQVSYFYITRRLARRIQNKAIKRNNIVACWCSIEHQKSLQCFHISFFFSHFFFLFFFGWKQTINFTYNLLISINTMYILIPSS